MKRLKGELGVGHGQRGEGDQCGGDDKGSGREQQISLPETGIGSIVRNIYNHDCSSLPGGVPAGVQDEDGEQGGGVVGGEPAQLSTTPQLGPRRVGNFLLSDVLSD